MDVFLRVIITYFPLIFWLAVIVFIVLYFRKRNYEFSKKVRQFDFEQSKRGAGWIKIQPLVAIHIEEVSQWEARKKIITLKDGTKKKVNKVYAFGMEKELEFVRNQFEVK